MDYEQFVGIVQWELGQASRESADRAAQATFQTLAERLSRGQARDLVEQLPGSGPWLFTESDAEPFDYDDFVLARAVLTTLREALPGEEFWDIAAELPPEYAELWPAR